MVMKIWGVKQAALWSCENGVSRKIRVIKSFQISDEVGNYVHL